MYLPVSFVVKDLQKYVHIGRHIKSLIFSNDIDQDDYEDLPEINELAGMLADDSIGDIYKIDDQKGPNFEEENGNNILLYVFQLKNYNQRLALWKQKLCKLFARSNRQWILD